MLKFLMLFALLVSFSFFVTDVFSIEIELQKETDRIIDAKGWLIPDEIHTFQEQYQIIIDKTEKKNRISIGVLSVNPNDIRLPASFEDISSNPKIFSFTITNQFACAPTQIERACVVVEVKREGLGETIDEIRTNAREIADKIIDAGVLHFSPEFNSITIQPKTSFD